MQLSMFDDIVDFPKSYNDIDMIWEKHIFEGETDSDVFSRSKVLEGYSYSFYGVKAFEFDVMDDSKTRFKLPYEIMIQMFPNRKGLKEGQFYSVSDLDSKQMLQLIALLKQRKRYTFRNTISETFACCNSFVQCSDAKRCLHADDRRYNGCHYRRNLEAGRIFYGKNKNID